MKQTEDYKIDFKVISPLINVLQQLTLFTIKVIIATSILFTFLSVFIFNLEIQQFSGDYMHIKSKTNIIQVDLFTDNLKAYFFEQ